MTFIYVLNVYIFFNLFLPLKIIFFRYTQKYFPNIKSPSKFRKTRILIYNYSEIPPPLTKYNAMALLLLAK